MCVPSFAPLSSILLLGMSACAFVQVALIGTSKQSAFCRTSLVYFKLYGFSLVKFVMAEVLLIYMVIDVMLIVLWVKCHYNASWIEYDFASYIVTVVGSLH